MGFWEKVNKDGDCWEWQGFRNRKGYGQAWDPHRKRMVPAHRMAYELAIGPIPPARDIDHLCSNRRCVNPAHLEAVTRAENVYRTMERRNGSRDQCLNGHPYTPVNTYTYRGKKACRRCHADREAARRA